ncbi:6244_t:CDS:2, partial [Gigaspora margarita]
SSGTLAIADMLGNNFEIILPINILLLFEGKIQKKCIRESTNKPSNKKSFVLRSQPDSKKAKNWEKKHSHKQIHIHQSTITMNISRNIKNITARTISSETLIVRIFNKFIINKNGTFISGTLIPKRDHTKIQRSIGQEFADLDSTCSNFDHEEVFSQTIGQMQNYKWEGYTLSNISATILEIGFLEVVGNALYADIKKLSEDTEKVFKCIQISIYYQCQYKYHIEQQNKKYLL